MYKSITMPNLNNLNLNNVLNNLVYVLESVKANFFENKSIYLCMSSSLVFYYNTNLFISIYIGFVGGFSFIHHRYMFPIIGFILIGGLVVLKDKASLSITKNRNKAGVFA